MPPPGEASFGIGGGSNKLPPPRIFVKVRGAPGRSAKLGFAPLKFLPKLTFITALDHRKRGFALKYLASRAVVLHLRFPASEIRRKNMPRALPNDQLINPCVRKVHFLGEAHLSVGSFLRAKATRIMEPGNGGTTRPARPNRAGPQLLQPVGPACGGIWGIQAAALWGLYERTKPHPPSNPQTRKSPLGAQHLRRNSQLARKGAFFAASC